MSTVILEGASTHFGPRDVEVDKAAHIPNQMVESLVQPLVAVSDSASLIVAHSAEDSLVRIPAHSVITSVNVYTKAALVATTAVTLTVGITGNADGLAVLTLTDMTANSWNVGAGDALNVSVGSADVDVVAVLDVVDATAVGTAVVIVEYVKAPDQYLP